MSRQSSNYHITGCYYTLVNLSITACGETVVVMAVVRNNFSPSVIAEQQLVEAGIEKKVQCYL